MAMDPIAKTTSTTGSVPAVTDAAGKGKGKTKAELGAFEDTLKAAGAKLHKVDGHAYEKVTGGKHDGELLNTSGNDRNGQLFHIVERHGKTFHVYGSGAHQLFIGMPAKTGGTKASS
jgi:hypothetical protein